jgi:hypothetical protein
MTESEGLKILIWSQELFFLYIQLVSLFINLMLCLDLIRTLQDPFENTKWRFIKYLSLSIIVPVFIMCAVMYFSDQRTPTIYYDQGINVWFGKRPIGMLYNLAIGICLSLYMLVAFYSVIFAFKRLVRPGVSIHMRKLFLKKHAIYVIALMIIWVLMLIYNYFQLFDPHNVIRTVPPKDKTWIAFISYMALFTTGQIIVLIGLFDPFQKFLI